MAAVPETTVPYQHGAKSLLMARLKADSIVHGCGIGLQSNHYGLEQMNSISAITYSWWQLLLEASTHIEQGSIKRLWNITGLG